MECILKLTGIFAVEIVAPEKATVAEGALIPSITISFVTNDCLNNGRLFCITEKKPSIPLFKPETNNLPLRNQSNTAVDLH